jgi:hypothetical protein
MGVVLYSVFDLSHRVCGIALYYVRVSDFFFCQGLMMKGGAWHCSYFVTVSDNSCAPLLGTVFDL